MGQWQKTQGGDVVDVPPALDDMYKADPAWEPFKAPKGDKATSTTNRGGTNA